MALKTATCRAEFKAVDADKGIVEALVSVFGNVDFGGDKVLPGAFTDTLAEWAAKGDPIPFVWSHRWSDPMAHIGVVVDAKETDAGLLVTAQIDLDRPVAEQVFHLLKNRRVTQFSFGYEAKEEAFVKDADSPFGGMIRELRKVDLWEVGPTFQGMNPDTQLLRAAGMPDPDQAPPAQEKAAEDTPRDDPATIALERRAAALMAKTRHAHEE